MFEKLFLIFYPHVANTDAILSIIRHVENLIVNERSRAVNEYREQYRINEDAHKKQVHELLVIIAKYHDGVSGALARGQKVEALKALRNSVGFQNVSLKAIKDAVEDSRVMSAKDADLIALREKLMGTPDYDEQ